MKLAAYSQEGDGTCVIERLRELLRKSGTAGTAGLAVFVVLVLAGLVWLFYSTLGPSSASRHNSQRVYICAETGKTFNYNVKPGKLFPVYSPYSKKDTAYPAQFCFWTAEGTLKKEPTYVLLGMYQNIKGPTFCPDCNRLVPADNPVVTEGATPPPTKEEYAKRRTRKSDEGDDI